MTDSATKIKPLPRRHGDSITLAHGSGGKACTPETPLGALMVSTEGACSAYYQYGRTRQAASN